MFHKVLKMFFTLLTKYENKRETHGFRGRCEMLHQMRIAAIRAQETIIGDALGALALLVTLVGALYLPGLV